MISDDESLDPDFIDKSSKNDIEDYICCICQLIPNPQICLEEENCGHLFCYSCMNDWLKKSKNCPFCKSAISKRSIKDKNKIVYRHLINLVILCQEENCDWKGIWKEYAEHLRKNHYKAVELKGNNSFELYKYYKSTTHEHPLKYLDVTMDNGWYCNGRSLENKCFSGIEDFRKTKGIKRFRCMQCDYDLCELCMKNYYDQNYKIKNDETNNRDLYFFRKKYYTQIHNHPLLFLDKSADNNNWACDGRNLSTKCFSGITSFGQSKGIPRFRCVKCNFDLCENCMDYYKIKINYELYKSYKVSVHLHPLVFFDKTKEDDNWACDGRKFKTKCLSGITTVGQNKGIPRFRCEKCNFDLCKKCMDYYHSKKENCLIF